MKRILPVENPVITHDPPAANLFSILGTDPNTESWMEVSAVFRSDSRITSNHNLLKLKRT